mmetsp:Transcript_2240/g.7491  ORF Transcript_2240/g.7491 Transcript_2240/m.7491 type:complete len:349 (-) Transcript_2240:50-1096(-)
MKEEWVSVRRSVGRSVGPSGAIIHHRSRGTNECGGRSYFRSLARCGKRREGDGRPSGGGPFFSFIKRKSIDRRSSGARSEVSEGEAEGGAVAHVDAVPLVDGGLGGVWVFVEDHAVAGGGRGIEVDGEVVDGAEFFEGAADGRFAHARGEAGEEDALLLGGFHGHHGIRSSEEHDVLGRVGVARLGFFLVVEVFDEAVVLVVVPLVEEVAAVAVDPGHFVADDRALARVRRGLRPHGLLPVVPRTNADLREQQKALEVRHALRLLEPQRPELVPDGPVGPSLEPLDFLLRLGRLHVEVRVRRALDRRIQLRRRRHLRKRTERRRRQEERRPHRAQRQHLPQHLSRTNR